MWCSTGLFSLPKWLYIRQTVSEDLESAKALEDSNSDIGQDLSVPCCYQIQVRPNKPKHLSLEQRNFYCRAMQGDWVAHAPPKP